LLERHLLRLSVRIHGPDHRRPVNAGDSNGPGSYIHQLPDGESKCSLSSIISRSLSSSLYFQLCCLLPLALQRSLCRQHSCCQSFPVIRKPGRHLSSPGSWIYRWMVTSKKNMQSRAWPISMDTSMTQPNHQRLKSSKPMFHIPPGSWCDGP